MAALLIVAGCGSGTPETVPTKTVQTSKPAKAPDPVKTEATSPQQQADQQAVSEDLANEWRMLTEGLPKGTVSLTEANGEGEKALGKFTVGEKGEIYAVSQGEPVEIEFVPAMGGASTTMKMTSPPQKQTLTPGEYEVTVRCPGQWHVALFQ